MLIVKKFGGTSVADSDKIRRVAEQCVKDYEEGNKVVVVLSAMGNQTDELLAQAKDINPKAPKREIDMLLTTGEQKSVAYMAMALEAMGVPAISFHAFQVGILTNNNYGNARIKEINITPIMKQLEMGKIVVITGFQGVNEWGDYTTLGRGGSDTTAVALAAALQADACEIYTDVDGVFTADPREVVKAKQLEEISHDEMLEYASLGAGVLHNRSVELAKKYDVPLVVRSSITNRPGTVVKKCTEIEKRVLKGVTVDEDSVYISINVPQDDYTVSTVLKNLADNDINLDVIIFSKGQESRTELNCLVSKDNLCPTLDILKEMQESLKVNDIIVDESIAKVSIVGIGVMSEPSILSKLLEVLQEEEIPIKMLSTSEIKITAVVEEKYAARAVEAVHEKLILS